MANRTFDSGLLRARGDSTDALGGYTVVIFEKSSHDALTFVQELTPLARFVRPRFRKYQVFAVSDVSERWEQESVHVTLDNGYGFDVLLDIRCKVENARIVATRSDDDPLGEVVKRVGIGIKTELGRYSDSEVHEDFRPIVDDLVTQMMPSLREHALSFGLRLLSVLISPRFPEIEVEADDQARSIDLEGKVEDARHRRAIRDSERKHALKKRELELKKEIIPLEDEVFDAERARDNSTRMNTTLLQNFGSAMEQVIGGIKSIDDVDYVANVMQKAFDRLSRHQLTATARAKVPPLLLDGGSGKLDPLRRLISQVFKKIDELPCTDEVKRQVHSRFLHVVSEALLDSPDHTAVEASRQDLTSTLLEVRPKIPMSQIEAWNALTSIEELRDRLGIE